MIEWKMIRCEPKRQRNVSPKTIWTTKYLEFHDDCNPLIHHKTDENFDRTIEKKRTRSDSFIKWCGMNDEIRNVSTTALLKMNLEDVSTSVYLRFVHYISILMIVLYVLIRKLNYKSYFRVVCLRASSKLYIIIAFDMLLTEINSEEDGVFLYLYCICWL